ncbi:MAG: 2-phospho-L-lactate guanylyltransferase [Acidimicrobiales bacterium]
MVDGPASRSSATSTAVLVPIKAFSEAKLRLAGVLDPATRAELARAMAARVLRAARPLPAVVVCDDEEVRAWSERQGAEAVWTPGLGLNGAVMSGLAHLARRGVDRAVVAHADLPLATELAWLADFDGVTLVPDRHLDGTNVACVPTHAGFRFAYGAGSFSRHRAEAARLALNARLLPDERLGWDVDLAADLVVPHHMHLPADVAVLLGAAAATSPASPQAMPDPVAPAEPACP